MMEFFLSKVWLFVCGIAVTAVLVLAFSGMDHSVTDGETQRRVAQLAQVLDSVSDSPGHLCMMVPVADYLQDGRSVVVISHGYVSIQTGADRCYAPLHAAIVLTDDNGTASDNCTLVHGDVLIVQKDPAKKGGLSVQVAKERTVPLTA